MVKLTLRGTFLVVLLLFCSYNSYSQVDTISVKKDTVDYFDLNLEQLLSLKAHGVPTELEQLINSLISVASKKPLSTRESPSIVTLVTKEEIRNSGARDLIDILRLVPGLDFGVDVEGVVGLGIRGNWAHEGKVLLLIDGQEMNETFFASTQFGNHYPIDHIERIEIIRGPGSAIYGGFAEYGVINIITQKGEVINGVSASGIYGQAGKDLEHDWLRRNIHLSVGQKKGDFQYSLSGLIGQGNRSDRSYTDLYGDTFQLNKGNAGLNPTFVNLGMSYKNLSIRAIGDFYKVTVRDKYDAATVLPYDESFTSLFGEIKYDWKINDKLTLTPRLAIKNQRPWYTEELTSDSGILVTENYKKTSVRSLANVTASYNITRKINFVFGSEFYADQAKDHTDSSFFSNGKQEIAYNNVAFFTQGLIKTRIVNVVIGARYDNHNAFGDAFVPRVGLTKKFGKFNFKTLYSNAFRAPSIENINYADSTVIRPEHTQVIELEAGYQLTRNSFLTVNLFDISTKNPIVYYFDKGQDYYHNAGRSGTRGFETEFKIKEKWGYVTFNYSFYTAAGHARINDYRVYEDSNALLAFANHKFNLNASIKLGKGLSINPSMSFIGPRWGFTSIDSSGTSVQERVGATVLANLFVQYETPVTGLSVGFGVYNLLNEKYDFIQPYNGYHAPLPSPSREYVLRVRYALNFKKKALK